MFKPPAHKSGTAGQIVNEIKPVQYLREYIEQKQAGLVPNRVLIREDYQVLLQMATQKMQELHGIIVRLENSLKERENKA